MNAKIWYVLVVVLFVSLGLSACSDDAENSGCVNCGSNNPGASPIPTEWTKVDWSVHYPDFTYKGLSPSCTHCPMDACESQFYFYAKGGTVDNLLVYFEGGGACWHTINCIYYSTTNTGVRATLESLAYNDGIGDMENPLNPFQDWNIVYIPYCTGDVHAGANDYDYPDDLGLHLLPDFNHWTIRHRGKVNFRVVLQWIRDTFTTAPDKIFVAGSSAGAYGALLNFPDIKDAYPSSTVYCFPDAGNGIMPDRDAVFKDLAQRQWNFQLPWQVEEFTEGTNDFRDFTSGEMVAAIANHYPDTIVAPYTAAWDHNQIFFYWAMLHMNYFDLILLGVDYGANVNATAAEWNPKMYAVAEDARANNTEGNFRYYISPGCNHTILGSAKFYDEVTYTDTGEFTVAEWITDMLQSGLSGLPDVVCSDCDVKPDYPSMWESCD